MAGLFLNTEKVQVNYDDSTPEYVEVCYDGDVLGYFELKELSGFVDIANKIYNEEL